MGAQAVSRMTKILEWSDGPWFTTMEFEAKHHQRRPSSGLRDRSRQPETALKNEYLLAENRILKTHLQPGFRQDLERDVALQLRVARAIYLTHPSRPDGPDDLVGSHATPTG